MFCGVWCFVPCGLLLTCRDACLQVSELLSWPKGMPDLPVGAQRRVETQNLVAARLASLLCCYERAECGLFWVEGSDGSFFRELAPWRRFRTHSEKTFRFDSCRYGTPGRHRFRIATNSELRGGRQGKHRRLRGRSAVHGISWTAVAAERPARATQELAVALRLARRRLDLPLSAARQSHTRIPIPLPILQAIVALAWFSGNQAFAGVTLLAYFGMGRIGEVLATSRSDLLLPADDFWGQCEHAYLRLGSSKTSTRARGRVQHLKVDDLQAVACISQAFSALPSASKLFPLTPSAYRYRWNKFLGLLAIDTQLRLIPGGLRGGGAVWAYRGGMSIADIQWRMRLKHQAMLEYYLQEVGAITALFR